MERDAGVSSDVMGGGGERPGRHDAHVVEQQPGRSVSPIRLQGNGQGGGAGFEGWLRMCEGRSCLC